MPREMSMVKVALLALYFSTVTGEKDSKTPYEEIKHYIQNFNTRGLNTDTYFTLSVDEEHDNLLVGTRNTAFLVNLDDLDNYKLWNVSNPSSSVPCDKNKDNHCDKFVKFMVPFEERILLCWTKKTTDHFTGSCTWRNRTNLRDAPGEDNNRNVFRSVVEYGVPSKGPDHNDTAVITDDGTLFIGTLEAFRRKSLIYSESFKIPRLENVYTSLDNEGSFYDNVHFVKSFEIGHYVYFFFRERTLECASCGKLEISRVARICKGDRGGQYALKHRFVTFQKAKLTCTDGKDYPFNFNEIQDVWWDNHTNLFHAIFTSQPNAAPSSAICIYSLASINRVFDESPFKSFQNNEEHWSRIPNKHKEYFQGCKVNRDYIIGSSSAPVGMMATAQMKSDAYVQLMHDPLMDAAVKPTDSHAWFTKDGIRMTGISLDRVGANTVVYTSTDRGSVVKISQPSGMAQPCHLTEMDISPDGKKEVIKRMVIDTNRHVLYFGSRATLTKLSLEQCGSFLHDKSSCISAADPYCGWDDQTSRCVSVLSHGTPSGLKQNFSVCPKAKEIGWSAWRTCAQSDSNLCRCQSRPCQDTQNSSCTGGLELRLINCTVDTSVGWEGKVAWEIFGVQHGNWSVWGDWSECSTEAWAGVRNRTRTCSNPVPRRGGRPCAGESVQYEPCSLGIQEEEKRLNTNPTKVLNPALRMAVEFKVTCRTKGYKITDFSVEMSNETINCVKDPHRCGEGIWDRWGEWSLCSVEGFQIRRRKCKEEPCVGERLQERSCQPTSGKFEGEVEKTWDEWSECVCNHGLNISEGIGVMYRVPKYSRICPNVSFCADSIEFQPCKCKSVVASAQQQEPDPVDHSDFKIGHVIGAALIGCAFAVVLCVAAICYVNRKKKRFNVSKVEENSLHETTIDSRYSTIPRENGKSMKEPLSPTSPGKRDKNRNSKIRTPSPLKIIFPKRKPRYPVDSV